MSSPLPKQFFENAKCLGFCELVERVKYHDNMTSLFATHLRIDKVIIASFTFTISIEIIAIATWIPNNGEKWFKR